MTIHTCKLLLSFLFMILGTSLLAQEKVIRGRLTDEKSASINYATVMLRTADTSLAVALTDSAGRFSIAAPAPGRYFLRITAIGFKELVTETFEYTAGNRDLGNLQMLTDQKNLG